MESVPFVKAMRVLCSEKLTARLNPRVVDQFIDHPFAKAAAAMFRVHDYITNPAKGGLIGDRTTKTYLLRTVQEPDAERMFNGAFHNFAGSIRSPIGGPQHFVDGCDFEPCFVVGEFVFATNDLHGEEGKRFFARGEEKSSKSVFNFAFQG